MEQETGFSSHEIIPKDEVIDKKTKETKKKTKKRPLNHVPLGVVVPEKKEASAPPPAESIQELLGRKKAKSPEGEKERDSEQQLTDTETTHQNESDAIGRYHHVDETIDLRLNTKDTVHEVPLRVGAQTGHTPIQTPRFERQVLSPESDENQPVASEGTEESGDSSYPEVRTPEYESFEPSGEVTTEPPLMVETGGGSGGQRPPHGPERPEGFPEPEPDPAFAQSRRNPNPLWAAQPDFNSQHEGINPNLSFEQQQQHEKELADAAYYAEKHGLRRGLLTGLLAGGLFEHWRHSRKEKKLNKVHTAQLKKLEAAQQTQLGIQNELQKRMNMQHEIAQQSLRHELQARPPKSEMFKQQQYAAAERYKQPQALDRRGELSTAAERSHEQSEEQPVALPPDRRVESSTWHRIEIDTKTGRPAETPTLAYGKEFNREVQQEARRDDDKVAAASLGTIAAMGTTTSTGSSFSTPQSPTDYQQSPLSRNGRPIPPRSAINNSLTNPWLWIIATVVLFLIVVALILR